MFDAGCAALEDGTLTHSHLEVYRAILVDICMDFEMNYELVDVAMSEKVEKESAARYVDANVFGLSYWNRYVEDGLAPLKIILMTETEKSWWADQLRGELTLKPKWFGPTDGGGHCYAAEAEASSIASNLGISEQTLTQPLKTLSGGQRRRIELARILFSNAETMLLDEPTNHLDADRVVWLRTFLKNYQGGLIVISHDVDLVEETVNKVFYLDANRQVIDVYNMGWKNYLKQREADQERRKRERAGAEKKAAVLTLQAAKFGAKATKAAAAHQMQRRAEKLLSGLEAVRASDKVAKIKFPDPAPCGKTPLMASNLSKNYGSLEIFTAVDLAIDRGSKVVVIGLNGAGKTTLLRILAGVDKPDTGQIEPGHGLKFGYVAQEHETLDVHKTVLQNMLYAAPQLGETDARKVLGSFLFTGDDVQKPAGVLSGGEKTRLALAALVVSSANVLLLDEPTNNLDPASREEILRALAGFSGAVVLVSHDVGAVEALNPERVLVLPDGVEDHWSQDYADLISLS
jgi:ATPase subunit of ABC transporter with duplicated ATPase domains